MNIEEFVKISSQKHNNFYDYSEVSFGKLMDKVKINCPLHGQFEQRAWEHKEGKRCSLCGKIASGNTRTKTQEQILAEFKAVHGDHYDYSKVVYKGILDNVIIICPIHGEFEQMPTEHKKGHGCNSCNGRGGVCWSYFSSDTRRDKPAKCYLIKLSGYGQEFFKIGITTLSSPIYRHNRHNRGYAVEYIHTVEGRQFDMYTLEQQILNKHLNNKLLPTPPIKGGNHECFTADKKVLEQVINIMNEHK